MRQDEVESGGALATQGDGRPGNCAQEDFLARGERAWQKYLPTGQSNSIAEVVDRVQSRIDARRGELPRRKANAPIDARRAT